MAEHPSCPLKWQKATLFLTIFSLSAWTHLQVTNIKLAEERSRKSVRLELGTKENVIVLQTIIHCFSMLKRHCFAKNHPCLNKIAYIDLIKTLYFLSSSKSNTTDTAQRHLSHHQSTNFLDDCILELHWELNFISFKIGPLKKKSLFQQRISGTLHHCLNIKLKQRLKKKSSIFDKPAI